MIIFTWWCTNILVAYRSRQYIILFEKIFLSLSNYLLDYIRIFKASDDTDCETYIYTHTHTHTHTQKAFFRKCMCICAQSCSTLCSSGHGIFQARIPKQVAISCSRASSWPRDQTCVSCLCCIGGGFFSTVHLESPQKMYACNKYGIEEAFLQKIVKRFILANFLVTCSHRISVTSISLSVV